MARRDGALTRGAATLGLVALLLGGAAAGLLMAAAADPQGAVSAFDARLLTVLRFTLLQAGLSTLLAVGLAVPLALALNRNADFPGRTALLRLFALPMALPAIVAALALIALYGGNGWVAAALEPTGIQWPGVFGLHGVLLAHVFFNLPLATRLLLSALAAAPANHYRLAAQLGMGERSLLRFVEWPALAAALPGVALLVGMLCLTSFTLVLLLGGGPAATTIEVEIYQSLRYDFDPARAAVLVAIQLCLAVIAALFAGGTEAAGDAALGEGRPPRRPPAFIRLADVTLILAAALFVLAPLAAIAIAGANADFSRLAGEASVWRALATSIAVASCSSAIAVAMALGLASARKTASQQGSAAASFLDRGAYAILAFPATAIGAGWFLLVNRFADPALAAIPLVVAVNASMALPFAYRVIRPAHDRSRDRNDRLCASLGVSGSARWRLVDWPTQRPALLSAAAFAAALSLGDLGVIALFGSEHVQTLPWLLLARMGSYRTTDAEGLALMLGVACLLLMVLADRLASEKPA